MFSKEEIEKVRQELLNPNESISYVEKYAHSLSVDERIKLYEYVRQFEKTEEK